MVQQSYRVTDSATLRAMAHPLRQRILLELSGRRSARAADLAEIIGEPANAISYHLRSLAKVGLIVESPELARDSRDRVWTLAHPEGVYAEPDAGSPASQLLDEEYLSWIRSMVRETLPEDPRAIRGRYLGVALLTREESHRMFVELAEVLERWREHGMDAAAANPSDRERVFHYTAAFVGNRDLATGSHAGPRNAGEPPTTSVG